MPYWQDSPDWTKPFGKFIRIAEAKSINRLAYDTKNYIMAHNSYTNKLIFAYMAKHNVNSTAAFYHVLNNEYGSS